MQAEMPFGFIEVSTVLQQIARTRGFFTLGFPAPFFYKLKPLEQRLSIYLAKKFMSQSLHQRFVDDLAQALADRRQEARQRSSHSAKRRNRPNRKASPFLAGFELRKSTREGKWVAVFHRRCVPSVSSYPTEEIENLPEPRTNSCNVLSKSPDSRKTGVGGANAPNNWGLMGLNRPLASSRRRPEWRVENPGAMLTKILKDVAAQMGMSIGKVAI